MYKIKKLNAISDVVYAHLPEADYQISADLPDAEADAFLVRSANCHEMPLQENHLAFARAGAGVNNIPIEACTRKGIAVFNTPGANANAVKELVLCALLLGSRDITGGIAWAKGLAGEGDAIGKLVEKGKNQFVGPEIMGKTLGVIGLGAIGVMVANMATRLGMKVIGYDPYISIDNAWHLTTDVQHALNMEDLLSEADYITIHVPLMDSTRNYLDAEQISKMKEGVVLLNFARNGLINEQALFQALDTGKIARYITDFPDEACLNHKKVICTPHLGASTPESEENCAVMAAEELRYYLEVGGIRNSVNLPTCQLAPSLHSRITVIHDNLSGVIGKISSALGEANINIEEMVNKSRGDVAYSVFDLNQHPGKEVLSRISSIDGIIKVRCIG
jgi:D-3-phosphoglycerate dehydrogenase